MNVQSVALNSANVRYNNANDETRIYNIEANVNISEGVATSGDSGEVTKNDIRIASFNYWDNNHLNITFYGVSAEEQCVINGLINDFISAVNSAVSVSTINI